MATINSTLSQQPLPNVVSWPSLFWGLVPFAINSMTQPSGLVCGADADVGVLLRSSPIICILDAILILARLAYYYHETNSFSEARLRLIRFRYHSEYVDFDNAWLSGIRRQELLPRAIVFILAMSQMIKLFSLGGIIWTKVLAAFYLGSFLIGEFLVVWPAARMGSIGKIDEPYLPAIIPHSSVAVSVAFLLWVAPAVGRDIFKDPHHTLAQWSGPVIGCLGAILAIPALWYSLRYSQNWKQVRVPVVLLSLVMGAPIGFYFAGKAISASIPFVWTEVVTAFQATVWGGIGLLYASLITKIVRKPGMGRQRKKVEQISAWYFFLLHFGTGLLYYIFSYDHAGTSRATWVEFLG